MTHYWAVKNIVKKSTVKRSLFCLNLWQSLALLLASFGLLALVLWNQWTSIETSIKSAVQTELANNGLSWVDVNTSYRGRDVLLTGSPPNKMAVDQALSLTRQVYGVRVATFIETNLSQGDGTLQSDNTLPGHSDEWVEGSWIDGSSVVVSSVTESSGASDQLANDIRAVLNDQHVVFYLSSTDQDTASETQKNTSHITPKLVQALMQIEYADTSSEDASTSTLASSLKSSKIKNIDTSTVKNGFFIAQNNLIARGLVSTSLAKARALTVLGDAYEGTVVDQMLVLDPSDQSPIRAVKEVSNEQCQNNISVELSQYTIRFATAKANLEPESVQVIDNIASLAKQCPEAKFQIIGHTDNTGTSDNNLVLSQKRALAVVNRLIENGLNKNRLQAIGVGSSQPVAEGESLSAQALNRRIEFKLDQSAE